MAKRETLVQKFVGLSSEAKPTSVPIGSVFFEYDTKNSYKSYDGTNWSIAEIPFDFAMYGSCVVGMTASTTTIVVPGLAGYGNDFFNLKYYMQVVKNNNAVGTAPELQVRQITDYVSTTGTFTVTAFGANVQESDDVILLHESYVAIGRDDDDNAFDSSTVAANADGSVLERLEYIQTIAAAGAQSQIRRIAAGAKAINNGTAKILTIDSGTNGADIISIIINGVVGFAWTLSAYVPAADAVATLVAADKRYVVTLDGTETEAGLFSGHAIPYNLLINVANTGVGAQTINDVVIMYKSAAAMTATWEA